ncbi:MAG TPA: pilin [Candidatus Saccharimonadales bacterium]|nr:pilin [Candidatus Saccharimonadales bacterium]
MLNSNLLFPLLHNFGAVAKECQPGSFLAFPSWYQYLNVVYDPANGCHIDTFNVPGDFVLIALAIADILLRVGGVVAFGYVIWGGIQYVTSRGEPDKTRQAQGTIMNAVIGMIIAIFATAIVTFIGNSLG